jgi:hypothetical protein
MGLITTNSLRQTFNRRVVQAALDKGCHLLMAIPDHPWVDGANGAAVRIAMTVAAPGAGEGQVLTVTDEQPGEHGEVAVALPSAPGDSRRFERGRQCGSGKPLQANAGVKPQQSGVKLHGAGFIVTPTSRRVASCRTYRDYRNGRDLTDKPRGVMVIDAFGWTAENCALSTLRLPMAAGKSQTRARPKQPCQAATTGGFLAKPRSETAPALAGLPRYIATVETAKHRTFQFLDASILPDNKLIAIALNDAFRTGRALQPVAHRMGAGNRLLARCRQRRPVYNKSRCFETFPFPDEDTGLTPHLRERIAHLAEQIDAHRNGGHETRRHVNQTL